MREWLKINDMKTEMIGQIHDSIILDVHPDELERVYLLTQEITTERLPEAWDWITIPLEVDFEITGHEISRQGPDQCRQ